VGKNVDHHTPKYEECAALARRAMTDAEKKLWLALRAGAVDDCRFRRQEPIGPYFADFVCRSAMLVVEVDGGQHGESRDSARTRDLEARGYRVLRFWNNDVLQNLDGVMTAIRSALAAR
jgi:very-short-patch-repair endonuclease